MRTLIIFLISLLYINNAIAELNVCTTIRPLYSLVQSVTDGVYNSKLLVSKPNSSPHNYSLSPSELKILTNCDIIFLIDNELEYFLPKAIKAVAKKDVVVVEIAKQPSIELLSVRENELENSSLVENKNEDHDHHHHHHHHHHGLNDLHIWLNPQNAKRIVNIVADNLIKYDGKNLTKYKDNAQKIKVKLDVLDQELIHKLAPYKQSPYLVFHDAYQYFDTHYKLHYLGAFTVGPEHVSSAKKFSSLKDIIIKNKVSCIFTEPEFSDHIMQKIADTTQVKLGIVDAEWGRDGVQDTEIYFVLMRDIADNFIKCMSASTQTM